MQDESSLSSRQAYRKRYYEENKARLNAERTHKRKEENERRRQIAGIMSNIRNLFSSIQGDNVKVVFENPELKVLYNTLINGIRDKHLERLKNV